MKRLLIISHYFAPINEVASIRLTKLAKYFSRLGIQTDVLTTVPRTQIVDTLLVQDTTEIENIHRISASKHYQRLYRLLMRHPYYPQDQTTLPAAEKEGGNGAEHTKNRRLPSFVFKVYDVLSKYLFILESIDFCKRCSAHIQKSGIAYDIVLSSYGPYGPHLAAAQAKRKRQVFWLADFRDQVQFVGDRRSLAGFFSRRFQRQTVAQADVLISVSQGVEDSLNVPKGKRSYVIPNGFDPDDIADLPFENGQAQHFFSLAYAGTLYAGRRDLSPIFQAVSELAKENTIDLSEVRFFYAGDSAAEFMAQAQRYEVGSLVVSSGVVERKEALAMQARADVLLLASWNTPDSTGIVTGKVFEQMLLGKPILCTVAGTVPNSKLKEMIHEGNLGFCCEQASAQADYPRLKAYIQTCYLQWKAGGRVTSQPKKDYIAQFNYEQIAKELLNIIFKEVRREE